MVLLLATAVSLVGAGTGETQAPQGKKPQQQKVKKQCDHAKPYVVEKRENAWGWQDKIYESRFPTRYNERTALGCAYLRWLGKKWSVRARSKFEKYVELKEPVAAICHIFGSYCSQAIAVASCESHLYVGAQNGQYLGMFQMGSSERRIFGHGKTPLEQAYAAYKYFVRSGRDWSPWSCKPW